MKENPYQGLQLLHTVDYGIITGFKFFLQNYFHSVQHSIIKTLRKEGRVFLIGAGSSGRIAIDCAAKAKNSQVIGIIAGGDSSFLRAQEGFEDSEVAGETTLKRYNVTPRDLIFLISASGYAAFNSGCAREATHKGATIFYFCSTAIMHQEMLESLKEFSIIPLIIDTGPQAITGSTRLQAASCARLCIGSLFEKHPEALLQQCHTMLTALPIYFQSIITIIRQACAVFSHPDANFRKIRDETERGYITFIGDHRSLREIVMDTSETAPTFSTNPPRKIYEIQKKKAEYQAFSAIASDNKEAWQALLGRNIEASASDMIMLYDISVRGFYKRPLGPGNIVIGIAYQDGTCLEKNLNYACNHGATIILIVWSHGSINPQTLPPADKYLLLEYVPNNEIISTLMIKLLLNLISNGTMILMNKIDGNQMIDVRAANNKLIDRAARLTRNVLLKHGINVVLNDEQLKTFIASIEYKKKEYETKNIYTPSVVKIAVTMISKNICFSEAVSLLRETHEDLALY